MTPPDTSPAAPVDTSAEAVAALLRRMRVPGFGSHDPLMDEAAATLAAVVKERDDWMRDARGLATRLNESDARADTASRQLAEARAALREVVHAFTGSIAQFGGNASWNPAVVKARALLSGETTI